MPRREDELTERYAVAVTRLSAAIYRTDPIGIGVTAKNPHLDEYESVARKLIARAYRATDRSGLVQLVHSAFVLEFGERTAGPVERYVRIADELSGVIRELRR